MAEEARIIIDAQLQFRHDTESNWLAADPILKVGEPAYTVGLSDRFKLGDGQRKWSELPYLQLNKSEGDEEAKGYTSLAWADIKNLTSGEETVLAQAFALKQAYQELKGIIPSLSDYYTKEEIDDKKFITTDALEGYAKVSDLNKKLDTSVWDKFFVEDADGNLQVKVGLYSTSFISSRASDPNSGGGSGSGLSYLNELLDVMLNPSELVSGDMLVWNASRGKYEVINQSNIKPDLSGYVNEIATTGSGNAVTSVSKSGSKITFTKGATFLTAIDAAMVKSALGYTPYDASNPNGYVNADFVNSSIATNTATFRGTFETSANLPTTNVKANDYAFVVVEGEYQRYKYNGSAWAFEYTLNNSSYTAAQWAAINSGITEELVEKIEDDLNNKLDKSIWDSVFEIDEDGNLKAKVGLYSTSFISSRESDPNAGSGGGGGAASALYTWNLVREMVAEESGVAPTAYALKQAYSELNTKIDNISVPSLSGYATEAWVLNKGYITSAALPTKTSDLTNDSGFITSSAIPTSYAWSAITGKPSFAAVATSGSYNDLSNKPTIPSIAGLASESWVSNNFLSLSGGTLTGRLNIQHTTDTPLYLKSTTSGNGAYVGFQASDDSVLGYLGITIDKIARFSLGGGTYYDLIHTGNYVNYTIHADIQRSYNANNIYNFSYTGVSSGSSLPSGSQYGSLLTLPYRTLANNTTPDFATQIYLPNGDDSTNPNDMFFRTSVRNSWNAWQKVITSSNISSYAPIYNSSGNVLIGTQVDRGKKLCIDTATWDGGLCINRTVANSGSSISFYSNGTLLSNVGVNGYGVFEIGASSGQALFTVEVNNGNLNTPGTIHSSTGIRTEGYVSARGQDSSSDRRLKENIAPLRNALNYVLGTNYVSFNWKDTREKSIGIIAQEEFGREFECLVQKNNPHYSYLYGQHTALLGAALKEEDKKVEELKAEIIFLKAKVNELGIRLNS